MTTKVNKIVLQSVITDCENRRTFKNLAALFAEVAKSNYARKYKLDADDCYAAALELGCTVKKTNGGVLEPPRAPEPARGNGGLGRVKLEVSKDELQAAVDQVEASNTFESLGDLWNAVAETPWAKSFQPKPLTTSVIVQRVKEHGITFKTEPGKKKGRTDKLEIDKDEFQRVVDELEGQRTFDKLSDLWEAVAETPWAKNLQPRPLTAAVAYQRFKELGIVPKTQPKRRSRTETVVAEGDDGEELPVGAVRTPAVKMAPDRNDLINSGVPRRRGCQQVSVPAGNCPVSLKGTDATTVATWARGVVQHFLKQEVQMLPTALIYFVRQFYDIFGPEYKEVEQHILDMKLELYEED